jgi:hypothetical protein
VHGLQNSVDGLIMSSGALPRTSSVRGEGIDHRWGMGSHSPASFMGVPSVGSHSVVTLSNILGLHKEITEKPGTVLHTFDPSTWEVEAGGLRVQGQLRVHSEGKGGSASF